MKRMQSILLGLILITHTLFSSAAEVKWEDDTYTYYNSLFNQVPAVYLPDYVDYRQLCVDGAPSPYASGYQNSAACSSYCSGSNQTNCAACKTFRFDKVGPFGLGSSWEPARSCYIKNDLGMQRLAFEMKRLIRCDSNETWSRSQLDSDVYHTYACSGKAVNNPKGASGTSCPNSPSTKHPISIAYGNKFQQEMDYKHSASEHLKYGRVYNSFLSGMYAATENVWHSSSQTSLKIVGSNSLVYANRPDRKIFRFIKSGSIWTPEADISDALVQLFDTSNVLIGWQYKVASDNTIETYNATGKLISVADKAGNTVTYTLSTATTPATIAVNPNLPISMTDHVGRTLNFTYDSFDRVKTMTDPAGGVYTYAYDANNNLSSVTYPDGKLKAYHYGEAAYVSATPEAGVVYANSLTGITDEKGVRYATYSYDSKGRATSEFLAGNADAANLVFNTDGSGNPTTTQVTDSRGNLRTYNFTTILGVVKSTGQSQPAGSGCAASAAALTYDSNGNVASRTDFNGNKTTYVYDMARNLEISRIEGLTSTGVATPATRNITTTWHATWRLPLVISEYTGSAGTGTPLRRTSTVYDSKGNITSYTEEDPVRGLSRTTTTTYTYSSIVPSLVITKVVDGPRTGVNDVTTYTYYDADATCLDSGETPIIDPITNTSPPNLGCRGQLYSVLNGAYIYTYYNSYNHHGQLVEMMDNNALLTIYTYDLRQRLLSKTTDDHEGGLWLSSSLTYDDAGQVTQLTMEDHSTLTYTYDDAHRLTDIEDGMGNKVHYTLDAEGNRLNETTTDPQGNLVKAITRSYDALNRMQQVTGVE